MKKCVIEKDRENLGVVEIRGIRMMVNKNVRVNKRIEVKIVKREKEKKE